MNILATSGGFRPDRRTWLAVGPIIEFAFELAGKPERPKFCYVGTALGDNPLFANATQDAFIGRDVVVSNLAAFPMPSVADVRAHLLAQDVVWVGGGSVAGLLAIWRLHGWDEIFREVWDAGVVLGGVSAGSLCWHVGGTTDSFGPELRPVTNGLALLPYSNGVHYDSEDQRRPLYQQLIADEVLPAGFATDDGVGLHYRGTELVEALTEKDGKSAYFVERGPVGAARETPRDTPRRRGGLGVRWDVGGGGGAASPGRLGVFLGGGGPAARPGPPPPRHPAATRVTRSPVARRGCPWWPRCRCPRA